MNKLSHICFAALTAAVVSTTVSAETATTFSVARVEAIHCWEVRATTS